MERIIHPVPRFPFAVLLLSILIIPSLSCTTITSLWASPTPTVTSTSTPTLTPTVTPTETPTPTPEPLLTPEQRSQYYVILRYVNEDVHERFFEIEEYLLDQGYDVTMDPGPSAVGNMDIILYGSPSCQQAIDDLTIILKDRLDITGLERRRFDPDDLAYENKGLVIQIQSLDLFGPEL